MKTQLPHTCCRCVITGNGQCGYMYLGRPWGPFGRVVLAYTYMDACIRNVGWHNWGNAENERSACFYEYRYLILRSLYYSKWLIKKQRVDDIWYYFLDVKTSGALVRAAARLDVLRGPENWWMKKLDTFCTIVLWIQIRTGHGCVWEWEWRHHILRRVLE